MSTLLDSLLTPEQLHECRVHEHRCNEAARVIRGEPYTWPQVPMRTDGPTRRRLDGPRASRFGDLR